MRIRHVIRGRLNPDNADGIITHTHRLARAQLELGHDTEVYGVASRATEPEIIDRDGLIVRAFPWSRMPTSVHPALRSLILGSDADSDTIFHLQPPHDPAVAGVGRLLRRAGIPYFLSPHAMWSPQSLARARFKKLVYKTLIDDRLVSGAIGIHATAAAEIPDIEAYAGEKRIFAIRNSIDASEIESISDAPDFWIRRFGVDEGSRVFVFLGRLDPYQKGLDVLIDAWSHAVSGSATLALVGTPWKDTYDDLRASISQIADPSSVVLTGALYGDDKYQALAAADVYVQTSRYETSPYSIQEALACGLPAIVTPGTNFGAVVESYRAGASVTLDRGSIAGAIQRFVEMPTSELRTLGENARTLVRERHSLDRAARRMVEAYEAAFSGDTFENDD